VLDDLVADDGAGDLLFVFGLAFLHDRIHHRLDLLLGDRSLLAALLDPVENLPAIEILARSIALEDPQSHANDLFISRETVATCDANPAPPDHFALPDDPAVDHLVVQMTAFGAFHG
jgi:hypothetical protein